MAGIVTVAMALVGSPLIAQTQETQTSTGVARVSLIRGDVSMQRGDSGEWIALTVNTPLVPGDTIATGAGSRAEVQLDYSNVVRLDQNAAVKIGDLNASRIQLQVSHGTVDLAVFQGSQANSEVDTPNVAIEPLRQGTYRIDVKSDSLTLATVRQGEAQISTPQGSTNLEEGQQITVEGTQNPQYRVSNAPPVDSWDSWNRDRNGAIENAQNYNHVNRYYTGAQDLGTYGRWVNVPGYDWCWTPYVDAGWVPYSYGRWVWEPFYGWTWVSYDPWGWAPYHYGRWFFWNNFWCWWPGYVTPYYRPLWAPAYVSFFGFGYGYYHFSFGYGWGFRSIGWCPLGPHDDFHRWWGHGHSFNVVNFNNYYGRGYGHGRGFDRGHGGYGGSNLALAGSDFHVRRAIVTMPGDRFGQEAVRGNHRVVTQGMLERADVVHGTLPVVPTRASLRVTNRPAAVPAVARSQGNDNHFFARRQAGGFGQEHSFNTQAASIRHMVETHNVRNPVANRPNEVANGRFQSSKPANQPESTRGARQGSFVRQNPAPIIHENPQERQSGAFSNGRVAQSNQAGWRRFDNGTPGAQAQSNSAARNSAPVVRGTSESRQSFSPGNSREARATQGNFHRFGTGSTADRPSGSFDRQNSAPVVRQSPQSNSSTWHRFAGNSPTVSRETPNRGEQRFNTQAVPSGQGQQNSNFRYFTPQSAPQSAPRNQGGFSNFSRPAPQRENAAQPGWGRFRQQPQSAPQREGGFYGGGARTQGFAQPRYENQPNFGSGSYSRPPLRLNKPIVSEPRYPSFRSGGGSAPSSRGSYRGGSSPSNQGGGGSFHGSSSHSSHGSSGGGRHGR